MNIRYTILGKNGDIFISYDLETWVNVKDLPSGSTSIEDQYNQWHKVAYPNRKGL